MIAVLVDKTGQFSRAHPTEQGHVSFLPTSLWNTTMFAIYCCRVGLNGCHCRTSQFATYNVQRYITLHGFGEPHHLYRPPTPDAVDTKPAFYRYINSSVDSATFVAMQNSVFPWRNGNKLPRLDDHYRLCEYAVPPNLVDQFEVFLKLEDVATQWISLARPEKLFFCFRRNRANESGATLPYRA